TERIRLLRRRWRRGARVREIAAELGHGITCNAVISKIHRLGISRLSPYGGAPGRRYTANTRPANRPVAGQPRPWTDDPILAMWSFKNVRREYDYVTTWIREHWREPHADDSDLFFAMAVARLVNWPDTLAALGYPVPWGREHFIATLQARAERGEKVWGDAYNI